MATTWADLKPTTSDFEPHRSKLQAMCGVQAGIYANITSVVDMQLIPAKRAMYADLIAARPAGTELTDIDALVDGQIVFFQQTLAMKQMSMHFHGLEKGEESADYRNWKFYDYEYEQRRKEFANLTASRRSGSTTNSVRVSL